ncbi:MAG TPA: hypothetical protein VMZ71_13580 [Gemmataceae bacterium]|nr:hypothetical protein [Gemmataceae bacterium]
MFRLLAGVVALGLVGVAAAQDKKDDKKTISGTWTREASGLDITFAFEKETLKITATQGENGVVVTNTFKVEKDNVVKVKVTNVEEKGTFPAKPAKDLEFSFKWTIKKDGGATLDELKGEGLDEAKGALEGDFKAKKAKKD